jgi:hypothetical protein
VRRAAGLAVGASLASAPVLSAGTALAAPVVPPPVVAAPRSADGAGPAPHTAGEWPDLSRHPTAGPVPPERLPVTPPATPPATPPRPVTPPVRTPPPTPSAEPSSPTTGIYQVRRRDCLWTIAARSLGPEATPAAIEAAWHRWYQANREVIGADPNLLLPGQRLALPSG